MAWLRRLLAILAQLWASTQPNNPSPTPPPPAPGPPPPVNPANPADGGVGDAIDIERVMFLSPLSPAKWPITAELVGARIERHGSRYRLCGRRKYLGPAWPPIMKKGFDKPTLGNWLVIAQAGGRWCADTVEWLDVFADHQDVASAHFALGGPLTGWVPMPGEIVWLMQTTVCRAPAWKGPVDRRTNIVQVRWP